MMRTSSFMSMTVAVVASLLLGGCGNEPSAERPESENRPAERERLASSAPEPSGAERVVLYSGRSKSLVGPLIEQFEEDTGIEVQVKYGGTAQLAATIQEEGEQSPADVFWAQDAGALGQMSEAGRFAPLPDPILTQVPEKFRSDAGYWVATSGRARVLAYAPDRVDEDELPQSVLDLTDPKWEGRVGWAPSNGSFQAFVTAMRQTLGEEGTRQWLIEMKENGTKTYPKNTPIIEALAAGEIDLGIPNHYYLLRFKEEDPDYPVEQTFFEPGDVGNLLLVAGVGVLDSAEHPDAAYEFINYLLSADAAQRFFTGNNFEYAVVEGVSPPSELPGQDRLDEVAPRVDLDDLHDLEGTLDLLREVGLL